MSEEGAYLKLHSSPGAGLLPLVWRFVNDLYTAVLPEPDATSRIALVTHEILENGVKYSMDRCTGLEIDVQRDGAGRRVTIRAENKADAEHRATLSALIQEIEAAPDTLAFYVGLMRRNARRAGRAWAWHASAPKGRCCSVATCGGTSAGWSS